MREHIGLTEQEIAELALAYEERSPQDVLRWTLERFGSRAALCTSFQADGMAILDMAWRIDPTVRVFTIDTGRLPQETYELLDRVREKYGIEIEVYFPDATQVESIVRRHGINLFYRDEKLRLLCCQARKVLPLRRVLATLDAWVTGLRREQSSTRAAVRKIEADEEHGGLVKVNPLADWTEQQVWDYIRAHDVPYHPFYDQGYTSIGCAPCTRPTTTGEDPRAGRWWWETGVDKECGMHCTIESGRFEREHEAVLNRDGGGI
ncbi:MAG: phosphoadenylyl-sulfate reductase [Deltaproteobacteria bacterium]|nr:phosphoadenylyl-sulfate reductase [Deltaproteobacteria bacterium]